eukprot:CAMPEP_0197860780 /NCGR_PEP_ID=MMETSP1438-20131217/36390_1 /TAXON_ID=1461541 /ORGANISM="Pterosperma sp., Strain CCMP1384" /LENGTH=141 /DNA_ID=CAMNT_0043477761 /DNA_START=421 /DNA_END=842 /DNA_ORIENTATION=+
MCLSSEAEIPQASPTSHLASNPRVVPRQTTCPVEAVLLVPEDSSRVGALSGFLFLHQLYPSLVFKILALFINMFFMFARPRCEQVLTSALVQRDKQVSAEVTILKIDLRIFHILACDLHFVHVTTHFVSSICIETCKFDCS